MHLNFSGDHTMELHLMLVLVIEMKAHSGKILLKIILEKYECMLEWVMTVKWCRVSFWDDGTVLILGCSDGYTIQ